MVSNSVAVITGGGSGMGLGVGRHLASKGWKIAVLDMSQESGQKAAEELDGIFVKTDVTKYKDQAAAFQKTWETYGRIDFVYANAGIVETYPWYTEQHELPPKEPSLLCSDVCLTGVYYSAYLAMHYMRQNAEKGGSLILTSSAAGIYANANLPIYTAAKFGVVGFMRGLAPTLAKENIRVNCTLPGAVQTNLCDEETWKAFPSEKFTPLSAIVDTVIGIIEDKSLTGQAVEISQGKRYYRSQHDFCDETQKSIMGAAGETSY